MRDIVKGPGEKGEKGGRETGGEGEGQWKWRESENLVSENSQFRNTCKHPYN